MNFTKSERVFTEDSSVRAMHIISLFDMAKEVRGSADVFHTDHEGNKYLLIPYCAYGDYDNSCAVERANYDVFLERFEGNPAVFHLVGRYGYCAAMVRMGMASDETLEEIVGIVEGLMEYPAIDDEAVSAKEYEMLIEAWEFYEDDVPEEYRDSALKLLKEEGANYGYVEAGGSVWIETDRLVEGVKEKLRHGPY